MEEHALEDASDVWMYNMRRGAFEEAWKFSDGVLKERAGKPCWHWPRHFQYIWDGSSLKDKRVLVRCYHGLGDTIQFIRYAPMIKTIAKKVIVWAQQPLIPLLQTVESIDQLLPLHDGSPEVEYDVDVEIMELPHIFRTTLESIPLKIPYLNIPPTPLLLGKTKPAIGIIWKAGDWDESRCIPFQLLHPLFEHKNSTIYILQADAKQAGWQERFGIYLGEFSLYDYARVIRGLDLVISVDSMPVHLAGALGIPVWTLLKYKADWRWMIDREESPWYPTMQLFRQAHPGDWQSVVQRVKAALDEQFLVK